MSKVKIIAHPETGKLFTETSKEGWVKCQLQSEELVVSNGVISLQKRVAFPLLNANVIPALSGLKDGSAFPIEGKITRKVTSEPQYEGQKQVVNPTTGEEMGYYQSYAFTTNLQEQDVDERTSVAAPAIAQAEPMKANTAFDGEV